MQLLDDNDFKILKEKLSKEGSIAVSLKQNEAKFILAVAANRRGSPIISDGEYDKLKINLKKENSWVVDRMVDPLEKEGVDTFLSQLHRQLMSSDPDVPAY